MSNQIEKIPVIQGNPQSTYPFSQNPTEFCIIEVKTVPWVAVEEEFGRLAMLWKGLHFGYVPGFPEHQCTQLLHLHV